MLINVAILRCLVLTFIIILYILDATILESLYGLQRKNIIPSAKSTNLNDQRDFKLTAFQKHVSAISMVCCYTSILILFYLVLN